MKLTRILAILVAICTLVSSVLLLSSCDDFFSGITGKHKHSMSKVLGLEATCTTDGNVEHYVCKDCGKKYEDAEGKIELSSTVIPAKHTGGTEIRGEKEATGTADGYTGDLYCLGCGAKISSGEYIISNNHTHKLENVSRVEPSCKEDGNIRYYKCSLCGKSFLNSAGSIEISPEDTIVPATHTGGTEIRNYKEATEESAGYTGDKYCLGCGEKISSGSVINKLVHTHLMKKTPAVAETCNDKGNIEYYTCLKCDKIYSDANGTNEISSADVIVNPRHKYVYANCSVCGIQRIETSGLEYALNPDNASYSVIGIGTAEGPDLVIPRTYNGLPVTSIGKNAFTDCEMFRSITIQMSITSIGSGAFSGCTYVEEIYYDAANVTSSSSVFKRIGTKVDGTCVYIGKHVTNIPDNLFYSSYRISSVEFEEGSVCQSIGNYAFEECYSLKSIELPASVKSIGNRAFSHCDNLESIVLSNGIEKIESYAFEYCVSLKNVTIPKSVNSLDMYAFKYCEALESVVINAAITSISKNTFYMCTSLVSVVISDTVVTIEMFAFDYCSKLVEVYYYGNSTQWSNISIGSFNGALEEVRVYYYREKSPSKLGNFWRMVDGKPEIWPEYIGETYSEGLEYVLNSDNASYTVTGLGDCEDSVVIIPAEYEGLPVTAMTEEAFKGCLSITGITIPGSIKVIPDSGFDECKNLTSIIMLEGVTHIGKYAFGDCDSLTSITIPNTVTTIGFNAFVSCDIITRIDIPDSVTNLADGAIISCGKLEIVTIGKNVTNFPIFNYCSKLKSIEISSEHPKYKSVDGVVYSKDGKTLICYPCGNLNTEFVIPDGVTCIAKYAFNDCDNLTAITIPNTVTTIEEEAFYNCGKITEINIPDSVTSIDESAIIGCGKLETVILGKNVNNVTLCERCEKIKRYEVSSENSKYKSVDGIVYSKDGKTLVRYPSGNSNTEFVIPDGVTVIGELAFSFNRNLRKLTIPNSVTMVANAAFLNCLDDLFNSYDNALYLGNDENPYLLLVNVKNSSITSCNIHKDTKMIGSVAFYWCGGLTSIVIPEGVTYIGTYAFGGCENLTYVSIPNTVTKIDQGAFESCKSLKAITLPSELTGIDNFVFNGCESLEIVIIPEKVAYIGYYAFADCLSLTSVVISKSVKKIDNYAFDMSGKFKTVYYTGTSADWNKITIGSANNILKNATRYYYSETSPTASGKFWYYNSDGKPVAW